MRFVRSEKVHERKVQSFSSETLCTFATIEAPSVEKHTSVNAYSPKHPLIEATVALEEELELFFPSVPIASLNENVLNLARLCVCRCIAHNTIDGPISSSPLSAIASKEAFSPVNVIGPEAEEAEEAEDTPVSLLC